MSADLLRRAAAHLRDPYLCNTQPWYEQVAELLVVEAGYYDPAAEWSEAAVALARAILREPGPRRQPPARMTREATNHADA